MAVNIAILVFDDVEELDAIGPYEVFGVARGLRPETFDVFLVGLNGREPVRCVNGLRLLPDHDRADAPRIDLLLIPGGVGTRKVAADADLVGWVSETAARADRVASVCTGARVTIAAGLADGKRITTHWSAIEEIRAKGRAAEVLEDVRYVQDGTIIHSAGVSAGIDMALWLVGDLVDPDFARQVQRVMQYDPEPPYAEI